MFDDTPSPTPPTPPLPHTTGDSAPPLSRPAAPTVTLLTQEPVELGGPTGLEPTRYGDWERHGRCIDF